MKKNYLEKKRTIIDYIQSNPMATHRGIREKTKLHPERIFKGGLAEAFKQANIKPPRTFKIKTKEEKKRTIIDYIRNNPEVGGHTIKRATKINYTSVFKNIEEAYRLAGVEYPRKENTKLKNRGVEERKKEIIKLVRENPLITITELQKRTKSQPYKIFKNIDLIYKEAGIKELNNNLKRRLKKRQVVINFIRQNPLATQREINEKCRTHVQLIFDEGIFEAYKVAGLDFPYERLNLHGAAIKEIKDEANLFEEEISKSLSGYGRVNRLVKTKRGFADIILERKDKKAVIEVKNYKAHEISISQVKQLNKYLDDIICNLGFLICRKKPKKDTFLIGENKIFILTESDLKKIPEIMDL